MTYISKLPICQHLVQTIRFTQINAMLDRLLNQVFGLRRILSESETQNEIIACLAYETFT